MFQAPSVDPDFELRQFFHQPAGTAGVIQMDVGGNQGGNPLEFNSQIFNGFEQMGGRYGGSGFNQGDFVPDILDACGESTTWLFVGCASDQDDTSDDPDDLPDDFYEIFVIDPRYRPIGHAPLNRVMRTKRPVLMREIMEADSTVIPVDMDQEDVAYVFRQYGLFSAPVLDDAGRIVGVTKPYHILQGAQSVSKPKDHYALRLVWK